MSYKNNIYLRKDPRLHDYDLSCDDILQKDLMTSFILCDYFYPSPLVNILILEHFRVNLLRWWKFLHWNIGAYKETFYFRKDFGTKGSGTQINP